MAKSFRAPESQDFTIIENNQVVGEIRAEPNKICWREKGKHIWPA